MSKTRLNLKIFRMKMMLKQEEMAEKLGMSRSHYASIENGSRNGTQEFWFNLQKVFDLSDEEAWGLMRKNEDE